MDKGLRRVLARAEWHDVKMLVIKLTGCRPQKVYVDPLDWSDSHAWLVEFKEDVDLSIIKNNVYATLIVGERAVVIGVQE